MTAHELVQLHPCPPTYGRHEWIWYVACLCQENGAEASDAEHEIRAGLTRDETPNEVAAAVEAAYSRKEDRTKEAVFVDGVRQTTKPKFSLVELQKAIAGTPNVTREWLRERSPAWAYDGVSFLSLLFSPHEGVLLFDKMDSKVPSVKLQNGTAYEWIKKAWVEAGLEDVRQGLENIRFENGVWFLNQPVTGDWSWGEKWKDRTCRSQQNVTSFRWLVLESDQAPEAEWLRFLATVPGVGAVYTSGGKSVHALVRLDAPTKAEFDLIVKKHKHRLVTLGADPAAMTAVRLTRLPWCWRGDRKQELLYLNPAAVAGGDPIWKAGP